MNITNAVRRTATGAMISGTIVAAGLGLGSGTAAAQPPTGTWCPGQQLPMGGAAFGWDMFVCHDYWFVSPPGGNVPINMNGIQMDSWVWADSPPPGMAPAGPPPPATGPAPGSYCDVNPVGCHFFGEYGPGSHG